MEIFKVRPEEKRIFIINGSGGCGKDTFVEQVNMALQDYFNFNNPYAKFAYSFSSVDKIKEAAKVLGWKGDKLDISRKFLSDLKELSSAYNDLPHQSVLQEIKSFINNPVNCMLFIHIRESKDIARLKAEIKDCKTILVTNRNIPLITTNMADADVMNFAYDYHIENDGDINDLYYTAVDFIKREYEFY